MLFGIHYISLWKMFRFHKIFLVCSTANRNSIAGIGRYSLVPDIGDVLLTSYFCICKLCILPLKTDIWLNVCESAIIVEPQVCARCFWTMDRQLNIDGMKLLNKKIDMTGTYQVVWWIAGKWSSMQWCRAHMPAIPTSTKLRILHLAKKINHGNSPQWKIAWQIRIFLDSVINTKTNWYVSTFHQMPVFNGKTYNLQMQKFDISMMSPVAKNI